MLAENVRISSQTYQSRRSNLYYTEAVAVDPLLYVADPQAISSGGSAIWVWSWLK